MCGGGDGARPSVWGEGGTEHALVWGGARPSVGGGGGTGDGARPSVWGGGGDGARPSVGGGGHALVWGGGGGRDGARPSVGGGGGTEHALVCTYVCTSMIWSAINSTCACPLCPHPLIIIHLCKDPLQNSVSERRYTTSSLSL